MEAYRESKAKLFRGLTDPERQRAVVNLDDDEAPFFTAAAAAVPVITFATKVRRRRCKQRPRLETHHHPGFKV